MRKHVFAQAKTKTQISCAVTVQLISAFVFHSINSKSPRNFKPVAILYGHWSFRPITISAHDHFGPLPFRPITCMSQNDDLVVELCDQIAKYYFHTSCYTHQINFLQYNIWVMYSLGHLLRRQDKLLLIISKCSYIEMNLKFIWILS